MTKDFYQFTFFKHLLAIIIIFSILAPAFGQRRTSGKTSRSTTNKKSTAETKNVAENQEEPAEACVGWRGKITYFEKKQNENYKSKGQYGWEKHKSESIKSGEMILNGGRLGRATMTLEAKELLEEESRQKGCCWVNLAGCQKETTTVRWHQVVTENTARGEENSSAMINIEGNRYWSEITLPAMHGKMVLKTAGKVEGSCANEDNKSQAGEDTNPDVTHRYTMVRIEGTIDPKNPNLLKGSIQPDADTMITWELARVTDGSACDEPLQLNNLRLEHHVFPNKTDWEEISGQTVDGNRIRLTATVSNGSRKSKSGTVVFKELKSGQVIGEKSVTVPAGGDVKIEQFWDTSGFAWTDDGKPAKDREIEASIGSDDKMTEKFSVYPKPVILVHGLWSNAEAWSEYPGYLSDVYGSMAWRGYAVGANPEIAKMNTGDHFGNTEPTNSIFQNAQELAKQIKFAQEEMNAWHVDVVAHSMGGLISRFYIHSFMSDLAGDGKPLVANLVMLGTPNQGSPCADLRTGIFESLDEEVEAVKQLRPSYLAGFNKQIFNRKGTKFSILAGVSVPGTCQTPEVGDGVVPLSSALYNIADRAMVMKLHTSLTGRDDFDSFVKPRLALGPNKVKQSQTSALLETDKANENQAKRANRIGENWLAALQPARMNIPDLSTNDQTTPKTILNKRIRLKAGETVELPFGLAAGDLRAGITFFASPLVTAALIDASGRVQQKINAGSPEAMEMFKTFNLAGSVSGNWKLRFENQSDEPHTIAVSIWADKNSPALSLTEPFALLSNY